MRNLRHWLSFVLVAVLLVIALPGNAQDSEIVVAIGGDPTSLDPHAVDDGNEVVVNDNIYESLLARDQNMELVPNLAESYELVDETTWRFFLREGVTFTNGEPMNAEAVVFSVNRVIDPEYNSQQLPFFETIAGAEAVDDMTVDILTDGPDPILPSRMYLLRIAPPVHTADEANLENPVGTGPYKFVSWDRGQQIVLEANEDYWGGAPAISRVVIRPIPEDSTRIAALQSGEVDLVRGLIPEQIDQAPAVISTPGIEFPLIRLDNQEGILADVRVRQALNYAVDKEAIAEALYLGFANVADGQLLTPGHFGYNPDVEAYPYDPDMARSLLEEAGYNGEPIRLVGESGRWLKDRELIEVVAGMLTEVGVNVEVEILEWSNYLDELFNTENQPDMIFVGHDNALFDADRTFAAYYACGGSISSYCNEEVTELIVAGRNETDFEVRETIYHEVVETSREDAAFLFLVNLDNIYGLSERLQFEPRLDGKLFYATMSLSE